MNCPRASNWGMAKVKKEEALAEIRNKLKSILSALAKAVPSADEFKIFMNSTKVCYFKHAISVS